MLHVTLEKHLNTFHLALDLSAEIGTTTVLLGESGAGKSTVLRLLAGLLRPQQGHIELDGHIYYDSARRMYIPPQERPFGYVFQDYVLFPHLTVFENVGFGLRAQHLPRQIVRQRVALALEQVLLSGLERRFPAQLSGGQQQRVAIARALALQPQLLLLDEPLAALDVQTRREVRQELRQILAESKITTILVTHHYLEALLFGQQILVLDHGEILQRGSERELRESPRSAYVAELVGVNFFHGHISGYEAQTMCKIQLHAQGQAIEVVATLQETQTAQRPAIGTEAYVIVNPSSITLYQTPPESSARNIFYGEVIQLHYPGALPGHEDGRVRVSIMLDKASAPVLAEITTASAQRMQLHEGSKIYATFKATEASAYS